MFDPSRAHTVKICEYSIGIDEVGRGALAGPVAVAALAKPKKIRAGNNLKDSKKLTPKQRERWLSWIKSKNRIFFTVSYVSNRMVDRINVSRATNLAAQNALKRLLTKHFKNKSNKIVSIILDGGIYVFNPQNRKSGGLKIKTIIKADEKFQVVKLASIAAKVNRDKLMEKLAKKHPNYGFEIHKGYGTKKHFEAIKKRGILPIHRLTFLKKR